MKAKLNSVGAFAAMAIMSSALAGPEWVENGDAGSLPGNAQKVIPSTDDLDEIRGALDAGAAASGAIDAQDMYMFQIVEPTTFYVSTSPVLGGTAEFDTQLWLFEVDGTGLLGNDNTWDNDCVDCVNGITQYSTIWNSSNDGTKIVITKPGLYLVAISTNLSKPASAGGDIFSFKGATEVSGPDGEGGALPITHWEAIDPPGGSVDGANLGDRVIEYTISLEGAAPVPAIAAGVDIAPGKCPNNFNPNSNGHTKVAILGAGDLDVHDVNLSTIRLSRIDGVGGQASINQPPQPKYKDVSRPYGGTKDCGCQTLGADGFVDLEVKFKGWETAAALELNGLPVGTIVPLKLTAELNDGTPILAFDCIRISH